MADVQLEHGHVRIANALAEAIVCAPFTATQVKLVLCIVRLSYGWRARTVRVSLTELATKTRVAFTGGFRRQFDELLRERVILIVEEAYGRTASAYAINKNFEDWGRFTVGQKLLESLYGERPETATVGPRSMPLQGHTSSPATMPPQGHPCNEEGAPTGAASMPPQGHPPCPPGGIVRPPNSQNGAHIEAPKDSEIQERQLTTTSRARGNDSVEAYATGLATAANNAIAKKWGEQTRTRPLRADLAEQMAFELIQADVPLALARMAIVDCIHASKKSQPPRSMNYFSDAIDDAVAFEKQRGLDAAHPAPHGSRAQRAPQRIANVVSAEANAERAKIEEQYNDERRAAAVEWGKDPKNSAAYHHIVAAANTEFGAMLETNTGQRARNAQVVLACAKACRFPTFEEWLKRRPTLQHAETS